MIIRPVTDQDLETIEELANSVTAGLTSLSKDAAVIKNNIEKATASFKKNVQAPGDEFYFFVIEDESKKKVVGTCSIWAQTGYHDPFYSYVVHKFSRESKLLGKQSQIELLQLSTSRCGPSEIGTLFLKPDYRNGGNGRLLSLSRFLFIANNPERFDTTIIAEMRGVSDAEGRSPFWESLGRKFFDIDFKLADYLVSKSKQFIADLMPTYPIYTTFLSDEAREAIGKTHENTTPALRLLESEGFTKTNQVDIFDAGPKISCQIQKIRSIKESRVAKVAQISNDLIDNLDHLVSNTNVKNFRASMGTVKVLDMNTVIISKKLSENLNIKLGDEIRYVPFKAS